MQPFFENVSKKYQNFNNKIKVEVLVSRSVFKLEKKEEEKIRETEEKLRMKTCLKIFYQVFKACGIFEDFVFELPQIHEGCFEYRYMQFRKT